jgi:hypothetical protein
MVSYNEVKDLTNYVKKAIYYINDKIVTMFGFEPQESLVLVFKFFIDKLWEKLTPIVFPMKKMYDSAF